MKLLLSCSAVFFSSFIQAQIVSGPDTVNEEEVTELSAVQTSAGTFLAACMTRHSSGMDAMKIYRSADNGITWDSVFFAGSPNFLIKYPDPVLCTDNSGNVYAAVMVGNSSYYDIWLYRSTDDGLTWSFISKPYGKSDLFCDLPSITSTANGFVYASYSAGMSHIAFRRSKDGGLTWPDSANFSPALSGGNVYPSHLDWTIGNRLCLSFADYTNTAIRCAR